MDGMNREKWNAMTPKQKREHIWAYYGKMIIAAICVLAVAAWLIYEQVTYVEPQMNVIITDLNESQDSDSVFREFLEKYGYETYEGSVALTQNLRFYLEDDTMWETNGTSYDALFAMFSMGNQEILISQSAVYGSCAIDGAMLDLSTVLPEELLEKHKDRLLYTDEDGEVEAYPCGVNAEGNSWLEKMQKNYKGYIGIVKNTDNQQMAVDFLMYFLDQFDTAEGE